MTSHDELSYYLSQGLAIRVDGITISDANLEHLNLILNEDDSYMKEYVNDQEGEIYAIEYQKIKEYMQRVWQSWEINFPAHYYYILIIIYNTFY